MFFGVETAVVVTFLQKNGPVVNWYFWEGNHVEDDASGEEWS